MIFPIIGLPGPFTSWCRQVALHLALGSGLKVSHCHIPGSLSDIARELFKSNADNLVFSVCRPDLDLTAVLKSVGRPLLFASMDPRRAALHLARAGGDHRTALRIISGDCSCLADFVDHKDRVEIAAADARQDIVGAIYKIAEVFGFDASESVVRDIAADTGDLLQSMTETKHGGVDTSEGLKETFEPGLARSAEFILSGYEQFLAGNKTVPIIVTKEFFLEGDPPHEHVEASLDMTGRPRIVSFGPYIHLPAGTWMLRLVISFSSEAIGTPCMIDVGVSDHQGYQELTRTHVQIATSGRSEVTLSFQLKDPLTPLQVRLATEKSVFDGRLAIGFAEFRLNTDSADGDLERLLPHSV